MSWAVPGLRQLTPSASFVLVAAAGAWAVFVPGLAPGLHQAANPGQMGGM